MEKTSLLDTPIGATVRISGFDGRKSVATKLRQYGLFIGDLVRVLRHGSFEGPVLVELNGREIALGREIASKVIVEAA